MRTQFFSLLLLSFFTVGTFCQTSNCQAQGGPPQIELVGGQSVVEFTDSTLAMGGLTFNSFSPSVDNMSTVGATIGGFGINGRDAAVRPTTFTYEENNVLESNGTVEHSGSVFFDSVNPGLGLGLLEIGDFSIGFDVARQGITPDASGFFVESTTGTPSLTGVALFDIAETSFVSTASDSQLTVTAVLLVSDELATLLGAGAVPGANIGEFSINGVAAVPEPSSLSLLAAAGIFAAARRRRK